MSGGEFRYVQDKIEEAADEIEQFVQSNDSEQKNDYGDRVGRGFNADTIDRFCIAAKTARLAAEMVRRVDWLVSCDDGEDDFARRWDEKCGAQVRDVERLADTAYLIGFSDAKRTIKRELERLVKLSATQGVEKQRAIGVKEAIAAVSELQDSRVPPNFHLSAKAALGYSFGEACAECGGAVEQDRQNTGWPTCHTCMPVPKR